MDISKLTPEQLKSLQEKIEQQLIEKELENELVEETAEIPEPSFKEKQQALSQKKQEGYFIPVSLKSKKNVNEWYEQINSLQKRLPRKDLVSALKRYRALGKEIPSLRSKTEILEKTYYDLEQTDSLSNVDTSKIKEDIEVDMRKATKFGKETNEYVIDTSEPVPDFVGYLFVIRPELQKTLENLTQKSKSWKVKMDVIALMERNIDKKRQEFRFHSTNVILTKSNIQLVINELFTTLQKSLENFTAQGTGWRVIEVKRSYFKPFRYNPMTVGSYIPTPPELAVKKCIINVKNKDELCMKYALRGYFNLPKKHRDRPSSYTLESPEYTSGIYHINYGDIEFPFEDSEENYRKLEKLNDFALDIYTFVDGEKCLHRASPPCTRGKVKHIISLLLLEKDEKQHFALIKNINAFYKNKQTIYLCQKCLQSFRLKKSFLEHAQKNRCNEYSVAPYAKKVLPNGEQSMIGYSYIGEKRRELLETKHTHVVYADIESCLVPKKTRRGQKTTVENVHVASHLGMFDIHTQTYRVFTEKDCVEQFIRFLATDKEIKYIVCFHNFSAYDGQFITKAISNISKASDSLSVTAKNSEKFTYLRFENIQFIDTFQHLSSSLDRLGKSLHTDDFKIINKMYGEKAFMVKKKGVFPYEWYDNFTKLRYSQLPSKDDFYSGLSNAGITQENYDYAQEMWKTFNCKTFDDYVKLYLKVDVLLLADIFEKHRQNVWRDFGVEALRFPTSPGLSWNCMLKYTEVEIELFNKEQRDMLTMVQKGMRGGISMITHRYAKANNPYISGFDTSQETSYISYLDANNLYGWAMMQKLPIGKFEWVKKSLDELLTYDVEGEKGCIVEFDYDYPQELHDAHNEYPLCPEKASFKPSPFIGKMMEKNNLKHSDFKKLTPNLNGGKRYICHIKNLQLYASLGIKITHIHRVLQFKQEDFLRKYIEFNSNKRLLAKTDFEKDYYKLMNNSVFGKTMEDVQNYKNVRLISSETQLIKAVRKPNFKNATIISDKLCQIEMGKTMILFNKPIIIGMCILDVSKTLMYDFHYNVMKKEYGEKSKLLFTDTDSLCYHITTKDFYQEMKEMKGDIKGVKGKEGLFDFSAYSRLYSLSGTQMKDLRLKKVVGAFKDECGDNQIEEFIGLRSKMYCLNLGGIAKSTAKGIQKQHIRDLRFDQYRDALMGGQHSVKQTSIRSFDHSIHTICSTKTGLSAHDDKRYVLDDGCTTLAHGHYKIQNL